MKWFREDSPIQPTWKYPIALYLYLKNHKIPSQKDIREHQGSILGDSVRKESTTIELMPLPSQRANEPAWLYKKYGVLGLGSRKEYLAAYKPRRVQELRNLVQTHSPKLVIFYSVLYLPEWTEVIGEKPEKITPQMYFAQKGKTAFCVLPQGRVRYDRLYKFARMIQGKITV